MSEPPTNTVSLNPYPYLVETPVPQSSVEIEGRSKGLPIAKVKVYHADPDTASAVAFGVYVRLYDQLRMTFRHEETGEETE